MKFLAGLLLQGDKSVQLVVLCAEKPSVTLLKRVAAELPIQLKQIFEENQYTVTMAPDESAVLVSDDAITVKVFLTSTLLRDPQQQGKLVHINTRNPKTFSRKALSITLTKEKRSEIQITQKNGK